MTETRAPALRLPAWLPNAISVLRIVLVPVFVYLAAECQQAARAGDETAGWRAGSLVTLGSIGLSDIADGYLARRHGLATAFGAVLDAAADKLTQIGLLVFFTFSRGPAFTAVPLWFLALILGRDALLATGWLVVRQRQGEVDSSHDLHGKAATVLVFALLVALTAGAPRGWLLPPLALTGALVVLSTAAYVRRGWLELARS